MSRSELKLQRDQAMAFMVFAVCLSVAVFLSVFGKAGRLSVDEARKAVTIHEVLLQESKNILRQNLDALRLAQEDLKHVQGRP